MSKILEASCVGSVVTADSLPVPGTTILSEGVGSSEGILILDEDKKTYVAKTSPDLKTTLTQLDTILTDVIAALTTVSGATIPPSTPAITANLTSLGVAKAALTALKGAMK